MTQKYRRNSYGITPNGDPNADGAGKHCGFRPVEKSPAQSPYRRKFMSIRHGGPCLRQCTDRGIRSVINNVGLRRSLFITHTTYFSVKPGPHQQQCRSNVQLCCQKRQQCRTSFALKFRPFDKVACCFDIVASVDRAFTCT